VNVKSATTPWRDRTSGRPAAGAFEIAGVAGHVLLGAVVILLGHAIGIEFSADSARPLIVLMLLVGLLWRLLARSPASTEQRLAVCTAGLLLLITAAAVALPTQYVIQGLNRARPWQDPALIRADLAIGIDLREVLRWTMSRPMLMLALETAYRSFVTQTFVPVLCAYCGLISVPAMRTYVWHFVVCLWITILTLWAVPVASPQVWWGYDPPLHVQSAMAGQLELIRSGRPAQFGFRELEGLVAFPSFHTIGALAVTVSCWRVRILGPVLIGVNALLIAATVLMGIHYAVDILAAVLVYAVVTYWWPSPFMARAGVLPVAR